MTCPHCNKTRYKILKLATKVEKNKFQCNYCKNYFKFKHENYVLTLFSSVSSFSIIATILFHYINNQWFQIDSHYILGIVPALNVGIIALVNNKHMMLEKI